MKYVPPKKFCAFPAMGYWEIDGKSVSSAEAEYGGHPRAIWRESEISKQLEDYMGRLVPEPEEGTDANKS
ncbi:hypothetical protein LCGC14_1835900 [marine sediment metagenome]|uniref:Uncharacterized protein n=1 Tax=marine sediment metagenome TaxID=412755 RepID=A0A0F9GEY3_9ZZZZ